MDSVDVEAITRELAGANIGPGGACTVAVGDRVGGFEAAEYLGSGRFSTVWGAQAPNGRPVALKIYRDDDYDRYYKNEVMILNKIVGAAKTCGVVPPNIIGYLGTFAHVKFADLYPVIHPCIVFCRGGDTLSELLNYCDKQHAAAVPVFAVKKIMREVFTGLAFLHSCGIIHADIKPGNILLSKRVEDIGADGDYTVYIADLGSSLLADNIRSKVVGTVNYNAPEVTTGGTFTLALDIWSAMTMCYELISGQLLFDVFEECDVVYGEDADGVAMDGLHSGEEPATADSVSSDDEEAVNYRLMLLITKVIGYPSRKFMRKNKAYYDRSGRLKDNPNIEPIGIATLLSANCDLDATEAAPLAEFLACGLLFDARSRITATAAIAHKWLQ